MTGIQFIRKVAARLGNNLDATLDQPLPLLIGLKSIERNIQQYGIDTFDGLDDVGQAGLMASSRFTIIIYHNFSSYTKSPKS